MTQKLLCRNKKLRTESTKEYSSNFWDGLENLTFHNVPVKTTNKILTNLDVSVAIGIDQIAARFLKDGAPGIEIHFSNIKKLSINHASFLSGCKIAKLKLLFKKGLKMEAKNASSIFSVTLISKVI